MVAMDEDEVEQARILTQSHKVYNEEPSALGGSTGPG